MSKNKKNELVKSHPKWEQESDKIRKVQISLDFPDTADILLRTLAARQHKAPSSLVREILGMPTSPPKRARIGVSFNDEELEALGERYDIDSSNRAEIRRRVTEEVTGVLSSTEESSELSNQKERSQKAVATDYKGASDAIYQRFQNALAQRNALKNKK